MNQEFLKAKTSAGKKFAAASARHFEEEEKRKAQEMFQIEMQNRINSGELNQDGSEKEGPSNMWEHLASFGKDFGASMQQAGGSFLDALVQGGQLVEQLGNESNPFINQTERSKKVKSTDARSGAVRDEIGRMKDIKGDNIDNRRTDEAAKRIASGDINARDLASLAGRAIGDATTATMFLNPVSTVGRSAVATSAGSRVAGLGIKQVAKEGLAFGAVDATAAGLDTFGATGDVGESLSNAWKAGLMSASAQVGLNVGAKVIGDAAGGTVRKISGNSKDTIGAATKLIKNLPEEALATPGLVDKINSLAESSSNVGVFRTELSKFMKATDEIPTGPTSAKSAASRAAGKRVSELDADIKRLQDGEDDSVFKYTDSDGTDVTESIRGIEDDIRRKQSELRDLEQQAKGVNLNTGKVDAPEGVDPSTYTGDATGRAKADEAASAIREEIQELATNLEKAFTMEGGVSRTIDTDLAKTRMKELSSERTDAIKERDRTDTNLSAEDVKRIADEIDSGVVPDEFIATRPPASNAEEAAKRSLEIDTSDSLGIQEAFSINRSLRADAEERLSRLMTQDDYFRAKAQLDADYKMREATMKDLPGPDKVRQTAEMDAEYAANVSDLEMRFEADSPRAAELEQAISIADQIDGNILDEWNSMEASNPSAFGVVDTDGLQAYRESLDVALADRRLDGSPNNVDAVENENIVETKTGNKTTTSGVKKDLDADEKLGTAANTIMADALTSGNTNSINLIDYNMKAPRTWIKRWGTAGKEILRATDEAIAATNKFNGDIQARSRKNDWGLSFKKKYMDDVVDFLDSGKEIKQRQFETDAHFGRRLQSANDIKKWLQETGRKLGLPEDVVMRDYLPHIIERKTGLKMDRIAADLEMLRVGKNANGKKLTDAQTAKLMKGLSAVDQQTRVMIASKQLYKYDAGILKPRKGADGWSRDLPQIISEYGRQATNELYMKPALDKMSGPMAVLEKAQIKALDDFVRVWKGEPITRLDEQLDSTKVPGTGVSISQITGGARRLQNVALMGGSARTVALQVFGVANIAAESTNMAEFMQSGLRAMASNKRGSKLKEEFYAEGGMHNSFSGYLKGETGLTGKFNKTEKIMYAGIQFVDENMRLWAYDMGKHEYARGLGKSLNDLTPDELAQAKKFGIEKAESTQFNTSVLDVPLGQTTGVGKMLTQIQQFNIKQADYNFKLFVGSDKSMFVRSEDGSMKFSKKGAKRLLRSLTAHAIMIAGLTSAGAAVFGEEYEKFVNVLGLDWDDAIPFGDQAKSVYEIMTGKADASISFSTPLLSALLGSDKGMGAIDFAKAGYNYAAGNIDDEEFGATMSKLPKFLVRNFAPGGTQAVRTYEGNETRVAGESKNSQGSTRFLMNNKNGWNVMKGLIGGQYATDEGQQWLRNGMNTIDKKHKIELPDGSKVPVSEYARNHLSTAEQAQWIEYYQTKQNAEKQLKKVGQSRTDVTNDIRKKLQSGAITRQQAMRDAEKWNNMVLNLYSPYLSGNQGIPPRLSDDLLNKTLIDVNKMRDTAPSMSATRQQMLQSYYDQEN